MDPLLRAAPAGRAIFVTSGVAHGVRPYWGPYAISKAGLEMLVKIYASEITKTRVRANLIDPGTVRTKLRARVFPGEDPARLPSHESVTDAFLALALPECTRNGETLNAPLPPKAERAAVVVGRARTSTTARVRRMLGSAACFPAGSGGRRLVAATHLRDGGILRGRGRARPGPCRPRCGRTC